MHNEERDAAAEANNDEKEFAGLAGTATTDAQSTVAEAEAKNEKVEFSIQALRKVMEAEGKLGRFLSSQNA